MNLLFCQKRGVLDNGDTLAVQICNRDYEKEQQDCFKNCTRYGYVKGANFRQFYCGRTEGRVIKIIPRIPDVLLCRVEAFVYAE